MSKGERLIGSYDWEDGSSLRITVTGDVPTAEVLGMVAAIVALKRRELEQIAAKSERGESS